MPALYRIRLTPDERDHLHSLTRSGVTRARQVTRARALLLADQGVRDPEIAAAVGMHQRSIIRLRQRAATEGVAAALVERPRRGGQRKLSGVQEARLIAEACTTPPAGAARWSMRLLAERLVSLEVIDSISDETVRRALKKTNSNPGVCSSGVSPRSAPPSSP
jgi:transposase